MTADKTDTEAAAVLATAITEALQNANPAGGAAFVEGVWIRNFSDGTIPDLRGTGSIRPGETGVISKPGWEALSDEDKALRPLCPGPAHRAPDFTGLRMVVVAEQKGKQPSDPKRGRRPALWGVPYKECYGRIAANTDVEELKDWQWRERRPGVLKHLKVRIEEIEAEAQAARMRGAYA